MYSSIAILILELPVHCSAHLAAMLDARNGPPTFKFPGLMEQTAIVHG